MVCCFIQFYACKSVVTNDHQKCVHYYADSYDPISSLHHVILYTFIMECRINATFHYAPNKQDN